METDEALMADLVKTEAQQRRALDILNALHAEGFRSLWLDSVMMSSGGLRGGATQREERISFMLRVVIDRGDLGAEELKTIMQVAQLYAALVLLSEIRFSSGVSVSRIVVWPGVGEDA